MSDEDFDELFHITTIGRLAEIGRRGLGRGVAQFRAHAEYSRGRTFLTDADGVDFWANRVWQQTEHNFEPRDQVYGIPILLLVNVAGLKLVHDERGSRDCRCESCIATSPIPKKRVWVWSGEEYLPVQEFAQYNATDIAEYFENHYDADVEEIVEEDEEHVLTFIEFTGFPEGWEDAEAG